MHLTINLHIELKMAECSCHTSRTPEYLYRGLLYSTEINVMTLSRKLEAQLMTEWGFVGRVSVGAYLVMCLILVMFSSERKGVLYNQESLHTKVVTMKIPSRDEKERH